MKKLTKACKNLKDTKQLQKYIANPHKITKV